MNRLYCDKCHDEISENFSNHFRLFHPDTDITADADTLVWPDGDPVVIEEITDFGG